MTLPLRLLRRLARTFALLILVALGTLLLLRFAPGYSADERELDPRYATSARAELQQQASLPTLLRTTLAGWRNGSLGQSRQYQTPVRDLLRPRLAVTASLLLRGIAAGWLLALAAAIPLSALRRGHTLLAAPFTLLLAIPAAVLATACILAGSGGSTLAPVLVLALLLAARDFKFVLHLLRAARTAPSLLQARAQGLTPLRVFLAHLLPRVLPRTLAIALLSVVTALSAIVPVEVLFDIPGLGQLAWNAAMNRDLPVLLASTLLVACAVALASLVTPPSTREATA
jgi:peptide/nickel transport system permease protein